MKYKQRHDGERFALPINGVYRLKCCDCGLEHDVVFFYEKGRLEMAAWRKKKKKAKKK